MELWYMHRSGQQYGPYTADQLIQMYNNRQLIASDLFFNNGQKPDEAKESATHLASSKHFGTTI